MLSAGDYELVKQKLGTNYTECNQWLRHDTRASHKVETSRYSGLVDSVPSQPTPATEKERSQSREDQARQTLQEDEEGLVEFQGRIAKTTWHCSSYRC